jgi:glutaredoxin-like protein
MSAEPDTPHPHSPSGPGEIVIYTRPGCPYCLTLRAGLRRSGLAFREINIWGDPAAAAFVRSVAAGNETVPTVVVGEVHMVNPSARRVRSLAVPAGSSPSNRRRWRRRSARAGETS